MILAMLLAAAQTAVDAEHAFDLAARSEGQWTAFRRFAEDDAVMFAPTPINAQLFLKDRKDPPRAVTWAPAESYVSCDGQIAVNTGPWTRPDGSTGYFTTVWKRADLGWKFVLDHGDELATPRPAAPPVARVQFASCSGSPHHERIFIDGVNGGGGSPDETLFWDWSVDAKGGRKVTIGLWNGRRFDAVIADRIAAP